jgi:hypothetical protein
MKIKIDGKAGANHVLAIVFVCDFVPSMESGVFMDRSHDEIVPASEAYEPPQDELERLIVDAWQISFRRERIGRNDNFFALGGNSLIGIALMEAISTRLDAQIPVALLFLNPTPRQLAQCMQTLE